MRQPLQANHPISCRSPLRPLRQVVRDIVPVGLMTDPDVTVGLDAEVAVQRAESQNYVMRISVTTGEYMCSTVAAKVPDFPRRRRIFRNRIFSALYPECGFVNQSAGPVYRGMSFTAGAAVTMVESADHVIDFEPDGSAQTASCMHLFPPGFKCC